jgi:hypothetical protein
MMKAVCSSEMLETQPTSTQCKHPKAGSTLAKNQFFFLYFKDISCRPVSDFKRMRLPI